jgi:16S rRNA (adenine(1408)-N(1))-methyltransferase
VTIDLGTGTGQAVLGRARQEPDTLVIGVDPDAAAMREASHTAARPPKRGGLANALFLAASAEELPGPLAGRADHVTVALPWGSLLHGLLAADAQLLASIAACLKAGGEIELLLSTAPTDNAAVTLASQANAHRLGAAYAAVGLQVHDVRPANESDVARLSSAWGRRLGIPDRRQAWIYRLGNGSGISCVTAKSKRGGKLTGVS